MSETALWILIVVATGVESFLVGFFAGWLYRLRIYKEDRHGCPAQP